MLHESRLRFYDQQPVRHQPSLRQLFVVSLFGIKSVISRSAIGLKKLTGVGQGLLHPDLPLGGQSTTASYDINLYVL